MTTLVTLSTKDCIVFGCDSLGSSTKKLIDPFELANFFDIENSTFDLKMDDSGQPVLKNFSDIFSKAKSIPFTHMTHMTKLFSLEPLEMALMITGISSIGSRTIKSLIDEFKKKDIIFKVKPKPKNYSVQTIAYKILDFIGDYYDNEFAGSQKPSLEFILGGYDKREELPTIFRIQFPDKKVVLECDKGYFGIVLGGQMREIQRIVFGTDDENRFNITIRHIEILRKYREKCNKFLKDNNSTIEIPELVGADIEEFDMFKDNFQLSGFNTNWGDFSEQNAIECVNFLVNVMIKSQQFCIGMPTVGGDVHIALITKANGVKFISKEEYLHEVHIVPKTTLDKYTK